VRLPAGGRPSAAIDGNLAFCPQSDGADFSPLARTIPFRAALLQIGQIAFFSRVFSPGNRLKQAACP